VFRTTGDEPKSDMTGWPIPAAGSWMRLVETGGAGISWKTGGRWPARLGRSSGRPVRSRARRPSCSISISLRSARSSMMRLAERAPRPCAAAQLLDARAVERAAASRAFCPCRTHHPQRRFLPPSQSRPHVHPEFRKLTAPPLTLSILRRSRGGSQSQRSGRPRCCGNRLTHRERQAVDALLTNDDSPGSRTSKSHPCAKYSPRCLARLPLPSR
jgi:hypothetical protein